jgi:putative tryptophan/tyrosine transport system substrate-binding protein
MRRRELITLLGSTLLGGVVPLAARAHQLNRVRRIGVLMNTSADDREAQARVAAFTQSLHGLGWKVGENLQLEVRWGIADGKRVRRCTGELVALAPDVILAHSSNAIGSLLQATRTIPIVFTVVADPVAAGYVSSLARPGGNATGFTSFEYAIGGKWLDLLKTVAPHVTRAGVLRESGTTSGPGQFGAIQAVAPSLGVALTPIDVRDAGELENAIIAFAQKPNGGLIVTGSPGAAANRSLIAALATRHRLPAVYNSRVFVADGGLISYGPDFVDQYRQAGDYVDRILKGARPADLPVQTPTKYELIVNLNAAATLGLSVPPMLLATADEVID